MLTSTGTTSCEDKLKAINLFSGQEHQPFFWTNGQPAALLVHGFPGTPAELRPLGEMLHRAGWTVHGPLLPGFGPQIETLFDRTRAEWIRAVEQAFIELQQHHHPVFIIGFSMGAALALNVTTTQSPTGLILLAPFWKLATQRQQLIGMLMKPFVRQLQPFKKADFSDPKLRHSLNKMLSGVNLDDPNTQHWLRELTVPVKLFEQLHKVGQDAYNKASQVITPTLIIQGIYDEVARLENTRQLLQQFPGPIQYVEVDAGHELIDPAQAAWLQVKEVTFNFIQSSIFENVY